MNPSRFGWVEPPGFGSDEIAMETRIKTSTATVWLGEDGIIRARFRDGARDNLASAKENIRAGIAAGGESQRPMLLDISRLGSMDKAARDYYARGDLREGAEKAVALVVNSPLSRVIGNFFLGLNKATTPTKLFTSDERAIDWLRGFLD